VGARHWGHVEGKVFVRECTWGKHFWGGGGGVVGGAGGAGGVIGGGGGLGGVGGIDGGALAARAAISSAEGRTLHLAPPEM
jgi:hypothetical protein